MDESLIASVYFNGENFKESDLFYSDCFVKLKQEFEFDCCAVFYKTTGGCKLHCKAYYSNEFKNYSYSLKREDGLFKLKIPIKMQNSVIGYFLFIKKSSFSLKEKEKANEACYKIANIIKDFEISKIFQNQLSILQSAIVEKNILTKKLEEKNRELIKTDKIRTEFLANVSHELRTPLNSIIGFSTALKDEMPGKLNKKQKDYANKILSSAINLTGIVNDILDMTKIEAGGMKLNLIQQNPGEIIREVINTIEPLAAEKNIFIDFTDNFKGKILIDYIKFGQIIYNLAGNAIKFSHNDSKIQISTYKKGDCAYISVKDFGIGIDKKNHKKIFEKFVQLDNVYTKKYSSTGLGLTITDELVKLQNGKITLKSAPMKGTVFTLKFKII